MTTATECMNAFARRFASLGPELGQSAALAYFRSLPLEIRAALGAAMERDERDALEQPAPRNGAKRIRGVRA